MATTITYAQFQTEMGLLVDAIKAGNRETAYTQYAACEVHLAAIELEVGQEDARTRLRNNLDSVKRALDAAFQVINQSRSTNRSLRGRTNFQR